MAAPKKSTKEEKTDKKKATKAVTKEVSQDTPAEDPQEAVKTEIIKSEAETSNEQTAGETAVEDTEAINLAQPETVVATPQSIPKITTEDIESPTVTQTGAASVTPVATPQTAATVTPQAVQNPNQITAPAINNQSVGSFPYAVSGEEPAENTDQPDRKLSRWILLIVVLLLLIIALLGAIFFYYTQYKNGPINEPVLSPQPDNIESMATPTPSEEVDEQREALETLQDSDSIDALESDIEATDLEDIDKELEDIEGAL